MRTDSELTRGRPRRRRSKPARTARLLKGLLFPILGAVLFTTVTPASASAASNAAISIKKIDGKYVVQGWRFSHNYTGTVKAGVNGITAEKTVRTNSTGYFWAQFDQFNNRSGSTWARAWFNVYRETSGRVSGSSSNPSTGSGGSSSGGTTTTTAKPKPTTTTTQKPSSTPTTVKPSGSGGSTSSGGWNLKYQDDFSGGSVDESKWGVYEGRGNQGIGYRKRSQVSVSGGELKLTGSGSNGGGVAFKPDQTYGKYEIRMKFDKGNGYNVAMLLWPTNEDWPRGGEVDIAEIFSGNHNKVGYFDHYGANNDQFWHWQDPVDTSAWHTYGVSWEKDKIIWFLDGKEVWRVTDKVGIPTTQHFLALQLDVAESKSRTNTTMHIDWVKIYGK
jgi:hypothetical protein